VDQHTLRVTADRGRVALHPPHGHPLVHYSVVAGAFAVPQRGGSAMCELLAIEEPEDTHSVIDADDDHILTLGHVRAIE
jgi:hypothetical protein